MQKYAEYIKEIEIDSLWSGKKHVCWELHRQVNILSGILTSSLKKHVFYN